VDGSLALLLFVLIDAGQYSGYTLLIDAAFVAFIVTILGKTDTSIVSFN